MTALSYFAVRRTESSTSKTENFSCYTFQCSVMTFHCEFSVSFLSEVSACIESILLSLMELSIFWQHLTVSGRAANQQKEGRQKQELVGRAEGRGTRSSAKQPARGTRPVPRGQASVSQHLINKWTQLPSFSRLRFAESHLGREVTWLFLKLRRAFQQIHCVLEPRTYIWDWKKWCCFHQYWEDRNKSSKIIPSLPSIQINNGALDSKSHGTGRIFRLFFALLLWVYISISLF